MLVLAPLGSAAPADFFAVAEQTRLDSFPEVTRFTTRLLINLEGSPLGGFRRVKVQFSPN